MDLFFLPLPFLTPLGVWEPKTLLVLLLCRNLYTLTVLSAFILPSMLHQDSLSMRQRKHYEFTQDLGVVQLDSEDVNYPTPLHVVYISLYSYRELATLSLTMRQTFVTPPE